jgi:hypothetical protein
MTEQVTRFHDGLWEECVPFDFRGEILHKIHSTKSMTDPLFLDALQILDVQPDF